MGAVSRVRLLLVIAALCVGFGAAASRATVADDDFMLLYLAALGVEESDRKTVLGQQLADVLAESGYPAAAGYRLRLRLDHGFNYTIDALAIATIRSLVQDRENGWGTVVQRRLQLGLLLAHAGTAALMLAMLWAFLSRDSVRVLEILLLAHLLAIAIWALSPEFRVLIHEVREGGHALLSGGARAIELVARQLASAGIVGFSPRALFAFLVLLVFLLRRDGAVLPSYGVAALSSLAHASHGFLLLLILSAIDLLWAPSRLRVPAIRGLLQGGLVICAIQDAFWWHLAEALGSLPTVALLGVPLILALLASLRRGNPEPHRSQSEARATLVLAGLAWLLIEAVRPLVLQAVGEDASLLASKGLTRLRLIAIYLTLFALADRLLQTLQPHAGTDRKLLAGLAMTAVAVSILVMGLSHPVAVVRLEENVTDAQLRSWLEEARIEAVDGLVFTTIARDIDLADGSAAALSARLRALTGPASAPVRLDPLQPDENPDP